MSGRLQKKNEREGEGAINNTVGSHRRERTHRYGLWRVGGIWGGSFRCSNSSKYRSLSHRRRVSVTLL